MYFCFLVLWFDNLFKKFHMFQYFSFFWPLYFSNLTLFPNICYLNISFLIKLIGDYSEQNFYFFFFLFLFFLCGASISLMLNWLEFCFQNKEKNLFKWPFVFNMHIFNNLVVHLVLMNIFLLWDSQSSWRVYLLFPACPCCLPKRHLLWSHLTIFLYLNMSLFALIFE